MYPYPYPKVRSASRGDISIPFQKYDEAWISIDIFDKLYAIVDKYRPALKQIPFLRSLLSSPDVSISRV